MNTKNEIKKIIDNEIHQLKNLSESITNDFEMLVETILASSSLVILTGLGKSGHIARKISATFNSTGSRSSFIHPSEASHGDLGLLNSGDILICISNSGETDELKNILIYAKRLGIKTAGVSSAENSYLIRNVDFKLILPKFKEADRFGIVPSTSCTATLIIGHAIAISVMHSKKIGKDRFSLCHPGGSLGLELARLQDVMCTGDRLPIVQPDSTIKETLLVMTSKGFGAAIVADNDRLVGIITDGDLRRNLRDFEHQKAIDLASKNPIKCPPSTIVQEAVKIMNDRKITSLIITTDDNKPVGLVHLHDLIKGY